jgi:hypothetical protein
LQVPKRLATAWFHGQSPLSGSLAVAWAFCNQAGQVKWCTCFINRYAEPEQNSCPNSSSVMSSKLSLPISRISKESVKAGSNFSSYKSSASYFQSPSLPAGALMSEARER